MVSLRLPGLVLHFESLRPRPVRSVLPVVACLGSADAVKCIIPASITAPETHRLTPAGAERHEAPCVLLEETSMTVGSVMRGWLLTSGRGDPLRAQHPSKTVNSEMDHPNSQPASRILHRGSDPSAIRSGRAGPTSLIICLMESQKPNRSTKWIFEGSHAPAQSSHVTQSE